jgi:3'(2'), 5'-bisphosphate nucleotidase
MIDSAQPEVRFALDAVRRAFDIGRRVQEELAAEGLTKDDLSPVTVADFAVQAVVAKALQEAFPQDHLVGEEDATELRRDESAAVREAVAKYTGEVIPGTTEAAVCDWIDHGCGNPGDRFWTLDPIDGTKGYIRKDQYAIALALIENGQVVLGVLGCPSLDATCRPQKGDGALLIAQRGKGSYRTPAASDHFEQLTVSPETDAANARMLRSVEAAHTNIGRIDHIASALGVNVDPVRMDSQAKYAVLASGGAEMLCRLLSPKRPDYKEKIWDQGAGSIVLEEAGGRITDLSGKPLDFGQGETLANNSGVFASNGHLHDAGLQAIADTAGMD